MRILLIADSLGCPRNQTPVEYVWTYRIIQKYSGPQRVFFTMMQHGLYTGRLDYDLIGRLKPDLVICQIGVVDCARRAFPIWYTMLVSRLPVVRSIHHRLASKYHYFFTKLGKKQKTDLKRFTANIRKLIQRADPGKVCFIRIADAGRAMASRIYKIRQDIDAYNRAVRALSGCRFLDPYKGHAADEILLQEDGHHLTFFGHDLVFDAVDGVLEQHLGNG